MPKRNRKAEFALAKTIAEAFTRQHWDHLSAEVRDAAKRTAKILWLLGYTREDKWGLPKSCQHKWESYKTGLSEKCSVCGDFRVTPAKMPTESLATKGEA